MPADRLLTTVLQAYRTTHDEDQTEKIFARTTSLLTTLNNPLNIALLTSQLLSAPAIWNRIDGLSPCFRIINIYNTAAIRVRANELDFVRRAGTSPAGAGVSSDEWVRAVLKGADDHRSPRWKHLLVLGGALLGMEGQQSRSLSPSLRTKLEEAIVTASNLALSNTALLDVLGPEAIVLVLNLTFPLLSYSVKKVLDYDLLCPVMMQTMLGAEGYQDGNFIGPANIDLRLANDAMLSWQSTSPSFVAVQKIAKKPLIGGMGPLSRLIAHAIENMADPRRIFSFLDNLLIFSARLLSQWRDSPFSRIDPSDTNTKLKPETAERTFPLLMQVLKTAMFATIVVLRSILGRTLIDPALSSDVSTPGIASKALHILRNIHFISSRLGTNAFSAYTFVFMTSIDILTRFPTQARIFLTDIRPARLGQVSAHPLDRNLDLFYLNTSEHFTMILSPDACDTLIVAAASPYLDPVGHKNLIELFEAAHSTTLAVFSAPQNTAIANKLIPFYTEILFRAFPTTLSPRQFRFAFKTMMQITTAPSPVAALQPLLAETLLELLRYQALQAPTIPMLLPLSSKNAQDVQFAEKYPALSEQAVLALALIDSLPTLPLLPLKEWLSLAADLVNEVRDDSMRRVCRDRLWEILENGEMDVDRAAACVTWWTTRGGQEKVLFGEEIRAENRGPFMSGGLLALQYSRL